MDRKSLIVLLVSFGLIMLWFQLVQRIWPPKHNPVSTNLVSQITNTAPVLTNEVAALPPAETSEPEQVKLLEDEDAIYAFTSHGGGIKSVALKQYPAVVACRGRTAQGLATVNGGAPMPILGLAAPNLFRPEDQFELSSANGLEASRTYSNGLRVAKSFVLGSNYVVRATLRLENTSSQPLLIPPHEVTIGAATPGSDRDERANLGIYRYDGNSDQHIDATWFANRTFGCLPGRPRSLYVEGKTNTVWGAVHNQFFTIAVAPTQPADQLVARPILLPPWRPDVPMDATNQSELVWHFFPHDVINPEAFLSRLRETTHPLSPTLLSQFSPSGRQLLESNAEPNTALPGVLKELNRLLETQTIYDKNPTYFDRLGLSAEAQKLLSEKPRGEKLVRLNRLLLEKAYAKELRQSPAGYEAALTYPATTLAPGASSVREYVIYAGPREYNTLARLGGQLKNDLDKIMGYGGFFGWFAKALLLSMNGLASLNLSYAAAIIIITIIIKTLFWPLTNASTRSMKRMAALQPQMKALQERYKDDPVKMNRKLMEFMKEHKVSPLGGCLPMFLQLPVFFGFFTMIRSAIELRGARFLWVCDLSQPDTLFVIPGFNIPFNLLPLLMGVTMLWQARLTPPSPGMDPTQQKIMRYMPLMFLVILYNFSAGLTLYWTVQNLLTIAQMKLTKAKDEPTQPSAPTTPRPALSPPKKVRRKP